MALKPSAAIYMEATWDQASVWDRNFFWKGYWLSGDQMCEFHSSACSKHAVALNIEKSSTDTINTEQKQMQR